MAGKRQPLGAEDMLLGQGQVEQTRQGANVVLSKVNADLIPFQGNPGEVNYKSIKDIIDNLVVGGDDAIVEW